ncbi:MAG: hypothetical protein LBP80_03235 [Treponema sp.]|jgi:hypothetical protein|nr:hypothetical protein [Treponema sp.]
MAVPEHLSGGRKSDYRLHCGVELFTLAKGGIVYKRPGIGMCVMTGARSGRNMINFQILENLNCIGKSMAGVMVAAYIYDERIEQPEGVMLNRLTLHTGFFCKSCGREYSSFIA